MYVKIDTTNLFIFITIGYDDIYLLSDLYFLLFFYFFVLQLLILL